MQATRRVSNVKKQEEEKGIVKSYACHCRKKISVCFPRCPPMFPGPGLAAMSPVEVTPMMVVLLMMVMIMLGGSVSQ